MPDAHNPPHPATAAYRSPAASSPRAEGVARSREAAPGLSARPSPPPPPWAALLGSSGHDKPVADAAGPAATAGPARAQTGAAAAARALSSLAAGPAPSRAEPVGQAPGDLPGAARAPEPSGSQLVPPPEATAAPAFEPAPHEDDILPSRPRGFLRLRWR